ncbi:hypothetical protein Sjap_022527 [Stephania japonica]|uniref:Uncharacterized protein n=1 Tax=Stephania japonica TaxID=461633 RepID=A0AAP0EP21_9MAGN
MYLVTRIQSGVVFGVGYDWATDPSFTGELRFEKPGVEELRSSEHQTRNEGKVVNATTPAPVEQQRQQSSPQHQYRYQGDWDSGQRDRGQGQGSDDRYTRRRRLMCSLEDVDGKLIDHAIHKAIARAIGRRTRIERYHWWIPRGICYGEWAK